jgi:uncharacterized protein (DUF1697 family)
MTGRTSQSRPRTSPASIALIRGINVGKAKRVAMADLKKLFEGLGLTDVRTLLNSGNVVFHGTTKGDAAALIEAAMTKKLGVSARVMVVDAAEVSAMMLANPFSKVAKDPSRMLLGVLGSAADARKLAPLAKQDWSPEQLAVGKRAAYLWCPEGISAGRLFLGLHKALGDGITARNWATMTKLLALAESHA